MVTIGITGPTGCGKTTLLQEVAARGSEIVDCDALYYELLREDPDLKTALEHAFGEIFLPDGSLDRPKLASLVFSSADRLAKLNEIVFFHVGRAVETRKVQAEAKGTPIFAIDAINLLESGMGALCDKTVCVLAPKEVRMQRIMARDGLTEPAARARIDAQKPDDFYRARCRYTLENKQTLEAFRESSRRLLNDILKEEPL